MADIAVSVSGAANGTTVTSKWGGYTSGSGDVEFQVQSVSKHTTFSTQFGGLMSYFDVKVGSSTANNFFSMCIDLSQRVARTNTFTLGNVEGPAMPGSPGMGTKAADALGWLWNSTEIYDAGLDQKNTTLFDRVLAQVFDMNSTTKNLVAGALQLATWKLVYDGDTSNAFDLTKGNFIITAGGDSEEYNLAKSFLSSINNAGDEIKGMSKSVKALFSPNSQDQLILSKQIASEASRIATPEPATIAIWGLVGSLGAFCGIRFNRRRLVLNAGKEILA